MANIASETAVTIRDIKGDSTDKTKFEAALGDLANAIYGEKAGHTSREEADTLIDVIETFAGAEHTNGKLSNEDVIKGLDAWLARDIEPGKRALVQAARNAFVEQASTEMSASDIAALGLDDDVAKSITDQSQTSRDAGVALQAKVQALGTELTTKPGPERTREILHELAEARKTFIGISEQQKSLITQAEKLPDSEEKTALLAKMNGRATGFADQATVAAEIAQYAAKALVTAATAAGVNAGEAGIAMGRSALVAAEGKAAAREILKAAQEIERALDAMPAAPAGSFEASVLDAEKAKFRDHAKQLRELAGKMGVTDTKTGSIDDGAAVQDLADAYETPVYSADIPDLLAA